MSNYRTPPDRNFYRPGRPHDYVYDPIYTTSSQRDFYKDAAVGSRSGARLKLRPVFKTMFSDLRRDVRVQACLTMPQPSVMSTFMPQYHIQGTPVVPMDCAPLERPAEVTGADRAVFAMKYLPQNFRLERNTMDLTKASIEEKRRRIAGQAKTRRGTFINKGVQTDYRESETQTDPYTPPYVLAYPGAYPKVMALIKLTWGNGLPASLEDIIVIERALERRLLETSHKGMQADGDFERRVKLMEELEAQRWADREKELHKILEQKLDLTYKLLAEVYNKTSSDNTIRLERLHDKKRQEADKYIKSTKNRYIRELRKMEDLYLGPKKSFKRDIMKDYTDFNSHMYAPYLRNGRNLDMLYKAPDYQFDLHYNFEGLTDMISGSKYIQNEMFFDIHEFSQSVQKLQPPPNILRLEKKLEDTFHAFRAELEGKSKRTNKYEEIIRRARAEKASAYALDSDEQDRRNQYVEEKDIASVTLQKIARGRIIQDEIRAELKENEQTLAGMKAMYDMDPHGLRLGNTTSTQVMSIRKEREEGTATDAPVNEIVNHLEGETIARMLDFLDKEMVRLLDERKVHSLLLIADRERRMREANEAGRRQHEEENRRTNDEIFREIVGVHQSTVDIYLEEAYLESINRFADDQSREYVQKLAETLNQAVYAEEKQMGDYESEEVAADLVSSFMLPELNRIYDRESMQNIEKRYVKAAEQVTDGVFSAHAIICDLLQDMKPILRKHLARGAASVEGGEQFLDQIIQNAVCTAMEKNRKAEARAISFVTDAVTEESVSGEEKKEGSGESDAPRDSLRITAKERKSKRSSSRPSLLKRSKKSKDRKPKVSGHETKSVSSGDEEKKLKAAEKEALIELTDDEKMQVICTPVQLDSKMKDYMALKSIEVTYGTEISQFAVDAFENTKKVVSEIFHEVESNVLPKKDPDDYSDKELNSDDD